MLMVWCWCQCKFASMRPMPLVNVYSPPGKPVISIFRPVIRWKNVGDPGAPWLSEKWLNPPCSNESRARITKTVGFSPGTQHIYDGHVHMQMCMYGNVCTYRGAYPYFSSQQYRPRRQLANLALTVGQPPAKKARQKSCATESSSPAQCW